MERRAMMRRRRFESLPEDVQRRLRSMGPEGRRQLRDRFRADRPPLRSMSPDERRAFRQEMVGELRDMTPGQRERAEARLRRFRLLPEDDQAEIRKRLRNFQGRSASERRRLRDNAERWRDMGPEQRERLRRQLKRLEQLAPEERLRLLDEALPTSPPDARE